MNDNYDRIARFYDVDMAQNMPFDDVGFYVRLCEPLSGPVLELGCGNGRILLELARHGIDAIGIDASAGMLAELRRKAALRSLPARALRMDVARLALRPGFAAILCPYSLITYVIDDEDVASLLDRYAAARARWFVRRPRPVPKPVTAQTEFPGTPASLRHAYAGAFEGIQPLDPRSIGSNAATGGRWQRTVLEQFGSPKSFDPGRPRRAPSRRGRRVRTRAGMVGLRCAGRGIGHNFHVVRKPARDPD